MKEEIEQKKFNWFNRIFHIQYTFLKYLEVFGYMGKNLKKGLH